MSAAAPQPPAAQQGEAVAELVALELERLAQDPPINGNTLAQVRVLMAAANVREFGIAGGAATKPAAAPQPVAQGDYLEGVNIQRLTDALVWLGHATDTEGIMAARLSEYVNAITSAVLRHKDIFRAAAPAVVGEPVAPGDMRASFEDWMSDSGKWPKAVERTVGGGYALLQASSAWSAWKAAWAAATQPAAAPQPVAQEDRRDKIIADLRAAHDSAVAQIERLTTKIAAMSAAAPAEVAARTDAQIVQQTEELAAALNDWRWGAELAEGAYRNSENLKAQWCWQMACKAQEILTSTDPENAVAELDDAPAGVVGEPVATLWQHCETGRTRVTMPDQVFTQDATWDIVGPLYLRTAPPARQALTKAEVDAIVYASREAEEGPTAMVQRIERACAEAWGVTLVGIGGKGGANG